MPTTQTPSPSVTESGAMSTSESLPAPPSVTSYQSSGGVITEEPRMSSASSLPNESDSASEMPSSTLVITIPQPAASSLPSSSLSASKVSNIVNAGMQTVQTQSSNSNQSGLQSTGQTMFMTSQSRGSSQTPEEQLPRTTHISSQPSDATRGPISTQGPSDHASLFVSSTASQSSSIESPLQPSRLPSDVSTPSIRYLHPQ